MSNITGIPNYRRPPDTTEPASSSDLDLIERRVSVLEAHDFYCVNRRNYTSLQACEAALPPSGGVIRAPAADYQEPAFVPTKPIWLIGDAPAPYNTSKGTRFIFTGGADAPFFTVAGHGCDWFRGSRFTLVGPGGGTTHTGTGIVFHSIFELSLSHVTIEQFPSYAAKSGDGTDVVNVDFDHCGFFDSKDNCLVSLGEGTALCAFISFVNKCNFGPTQGRSVKLGNAPFTIFRDAVWQTGMADAANQEFLYASYSGGLNKLVLDTPWMENLVSTAAPSSFFMRVIGPAVNVTIRDGYFARPTLSGGGNLKAMKVLKTVNDGGGSGAFGLIFQGNEADCGGNTTNGTDDCDLSTGTDAVFIANLLRDGGSYQNPWRYTCGDWTRVVRVNDGGRNKARAWTTANLPATDLQDGDYAFDSTLGKMVRTVGGVWGAFP